MARVLGALSEWALRKLREGSLIALPITPLCRRSEERGPGAASLSQTLLAARHKLEQEAHKLSVKAQSTLQRIKQFTKIPVRRKASLLDSLPHQDVNRTRGQTYISYYVMCLR